MFSVYHRYKQLEQSFRWGLKGKERYLRRFCFQPWGVEVDFAPGADSHGTGHSFGAVEVGAASAT